MKLKERILVALAFMVAAFYTLEVALAVMQQGLSGPVFIKAGVVAAALYYAIAAIKKRKANNNQSGE